MHQFHMRYLSRGHSHRDGWLGPVCGPWQRDAKEAWIVLASAFIAFARPPCSSSPGPLSSVVSRWMRNCMWQGSACWALVRVEGDCRIGICSGTHFLCVSCREESLVLGLLPFCMAFWPLDCLVNVILSGRGGHSCSHD